jgi:chromosome segregation ATPase
MNELLPILIGALSGGVLGIISNLVMAAINRKKNQAEIIDMDTRTDKLRQELNHNLQGQVMGLVAQVDALIERNREKEEKHEKERDAKRNEIDRIHSELRSVQMLNSSLLNQVAELQRLNGEKDKRVRELEQLVTQHTDTIKRMAAEMLSIKRVTGSLKER